MQLIYRGNSYTYSDIPSTTTEGEVVGKYRGAMLRRSSCTGFFRPDVPPTLTYRGTSYTIPE
jgi:Domain of unknown function (DUF4278)